MTGSRGFALALAIVYGSLPHFETTRFWFAAYQANISLLFFCVGAYCLARNAEASRSDTGWLLAGLVAMALSALAYELFLPLFLGLPVAIWLLRRRGVISSLPPMATRELVLQMAGVGAVALAIVVFKLVADAGVHEWHGGNFLYRAARLYISATRAEFFYMGALLPLAKVLASHGTTMGVIAGVTLGLGAAAYLGIVQRSEPSIEGRGSLAMIAVGAVTFVAGYGVLLQNFNAIFSEGAGIANRINIASSIGTALVVLGLVGGLARRLPHRVRGPAVLTAFAIGVGVGTTYSTTSGLTWVEAANSADRTFAEVQRIVPHAEPGSSILVYGLCPYLGPAPVFAAGWDLKGRLAVWRGQQNVGANVLSAKSVVRTDGIVVHEYNMEELYGSLQVVDLTNGLSQRLQSQADAVTYFASHPLKEATPCRFAEGVGELLF